MTPGSMGWPQVSIHALVLVLAGAALVQSIRTRTIQGDHVLDWGKPGCNVVYANGEMVLKRGCLPCKVRTLVTEYELNASVVLKGPLFGPLMVQCKDGSGTLPGDPLCHEGSEFLIPVRGCCDSTCLPEVISLILLVLLISVAVIFLARYYYVRRVWVPENHILAYSRGPISRFTQGYEHFSGPHTLSYEDKDYKAARSPIGQKMLKVVTFGGRKLLLCILLIWTVPGRWGVEANHSELWSPESGTVDLNGIHLRVAMAHWECKLKEEYTTGSWTMETNINYWCTWAACDSNGPCTEYLPEGNWTTTSLWYYSKGDSTRWAFKRFCTQPGPKCPFISGCWKWDLRMKVDMDSLFKVHTIRSCEEMIQVDAMGNGLESTVGFTLPRPTDMEGKSILTDSEGRAYYCPEVCNKGKPVADHLGDFQMVADHNFALASDTHRCEVSWVFGPRCSIRDSFMSRLKDLCLPLPSAWESFEVSVTPGSVQIKPEKGLQIHAMGQVVNMSHSSPRGCSVDHIEVVGTRMGNFPFTMHVHLAKATAGGFAYFYHPCFNSVVPLACHKTNHFFLVGDEDPCWLGDPGIGKIIKDESSASLFHSHIMNQYDFNGGQYQAHPFSTWNWLSIWLSGHSLAVVLIGSLLILLLIRK